MSVYIDICVDLLTTASEEESADAIVFELCSTQDCSATLPRHSQTTVLTTKVHLHL